MTGSRITIQLDVDIEFVYSATLELVSSLHVLSDPSHHANCVDWHEKVLNTIPASLLHRIQDFGDRYVQWSYVMDIIDYLVVAPNLYEKPTDDFPTIISKLKAMPQNKFAYIFLGETLLGCHELSDDILTNADVYSNYAPTELGKYIKWKDAKGFMRNIESVRDDMIDIMAQYYNEFFCHHWMQTSSFYRNASINEKRVFDGTVPSNYILSLHDDLFYENNSLIMKKKTRFEVKAEEIHMIRIIFSTYTFPHLMINIYGNTLSLYQNLLVPNMSTAFDAIANSAKVFGDSTRLAIIKLLLKSEVTTKTLAKLLNLSPASVSQHLKVLRDAGILSFYRNKNNVIYTVNRSGVVETMDAMIKFLELNEDFVKKTGP